MTTQHQIPDTARIFRAHPAGEDGARMTLAEMLDEAGRLDVRVPGDVLLTPVSVARIRGDLESVRERCALAMAQPDVPRVALQELAGIMQAATDALSVL
jgi:hypothetical protein